MGKQSDSHPRFRFIVLAFLCCFMLCGPLADAEETAPPEGQRTFDQFATVRIDDVVFSAGFQVAQLRLGEDSSYVPIVLAMQSFKHKMWSVKLKDFIFTAEDGTELKPIKLKEVRKQYKRYAEDYVFITRTTTLKQLLPSADISDVAMKERAGGADESQGDGRFGGGAAELGLADSGSGGHYGHTLFYPRPGQTAVYSVTLDFKQFFYDIVYFNTSDIVGKSLKVSVEAKKKRPALELSFTINK